MMKHVTCVLVNEIPGVRVRVKEIANKGQETFFLLVNPTLLYCIKNIRLEAVLFGRLTVSLASTHFETNVKREYSTYVILTEVVLEI